MGACREGANIWYLLGRPWWGWRRVFSIQLYRSSYFWQDSFWQYWNKCVGCRLHGHRQVKDIADPGERTALYCFDCFKWITSPYIGPVNRLALSKFRRKIK